jgi:hypothetical protein
MLLVWDFESRSIRIVAQHDLLPNVVKDRHTSKLYQSGRFDSRRSYFVRAFVPKTCDRLLDDWRGAIARLQFLAALVGCPPATDVEEFYAHFWTAWNLIDSRNDAKFSSQIGRRDDYK